MKSWYITLVATLYLTVLAAQNRDSDPVIIQGKNLTCMLGQNPADMVAFKFSSAVGWVQVPMQIDERVLLDIAAPYGGAPCVAGEGSGVPWDIFFYADTSTFVGADTLATFDIDDELVFMAKDLGEQSTISLLPNGVLNIPPCEISIYDSLDQVQLGYLYLFLQDGSLNQAANTSYVNYDFVFFPNGNGIQGRSVKEDYIICYNQQALNTENSVVTTDAYETGFSARWKEDVLKIKAGGASGEDILDLHQGTLSLSKCIRTTTTFSTNRGVIVNAINRPIRAIRSVMGTNSGALNQMTIYFTANQVHYQNDFRVHTASGSTSDVYDIFDFNENMVGATYCNEYNPNKVTIDGNLDLLNNDIIPIWGLHSGGMGSIVATSYFESNMTFSHDRRDVANGLAQLSDDAYYDDNGQRAMYTCTGDTRAFGSSGFLFSSNQCTDRRYNSLDCSSTIADPKNISMNRVHYYLSPSTTPQEAERYAQFVQYPLTIENTAANLPSCSDGVRNGDEIGIDCGGSCAPCSNNCEIPSNLNVTNNTGTQANLNWNIVASANSYTVRIRQQGNGQWIERNSPTNILIASPLRNGQIYEWQVRSNCNGESSNWSSLHTFEAGASESTCNDGIQNGDETGVDCGGSNCPNCSEPTCNDGIQNGYETGVDCGGSNCPSCSEPTCNDGIQNGDETGVDCGGSNCPNCSEPTCNDGIQNGDETGVDCGGSCTPCATSNCDAPINLAASNIKRNKATLSWSAVPEAISYTVNLRAIGNPNWDDATTSNTSIVARPLAPNVTYEWRVRSNCSGESSDWSNISTFTTMNSNRGIAGRSVEVEIEKRLIASLHPNPASENLVLRVNKKVEKIEIIDLAGRSLSLNWNGETTKLIELAIDHLVEGTYFIRIQSEDDRQTLRFVKQ